ncbi:MAG: metallophosphoesterase [Clostridiales bacterium]|nr:metallophosphoesterase [Clostridiales bacterium]
MARVFAISDLHLSLAVAEKSMDVFGARWERYIPRLAEAWTREVRADDLVLIPGDISWAMQLKEAAPDFAFLAELSGQKILLRGNHDYWWSSYRQVTGSLPDGLRAIQNNALRFEQVTVAGTRGWLSPQHNAFSEEKDRKIFERELGRLRLSLSALPEETTNIVMLHYPPFSEKGEPTAFVQVLEEFPVAHVVYGHLHGAASKTAFCGERNGIAYHFVSADHLAFTPKQILSSV